MDMEKYVYNRCKRCGAKVRVPRPTDVFCAEVLEETDVAMCNECDGNSDWRRC